MSDHQPFLAEICQHPDDDVPRLVYADWLEERGDLRADFIRLQCKLAQLPTHDAQRTDLEARELGLLRRRRKGWAGKVRRLARTWTLERGFVQRIKIDVEHCLAHGDELLRLAPIQYAHLAGLCRSNHFESLLNAPWLSNLKGVAIWGTGYSGEWVGRQPSPIRQFLQSPRLGGIEELGVRCAGVIEPDLAALAQTCPKLTSLDIRENHVSTYRVAQFCRELPRLRCLRQSGHSTPAGLARDLQPLLPQLETLELHGGVTYRHLEALADCTTQLRTLILEDNDLRLDPGSTMLSRMTTRALRLFGAPTREVARVSPAWLAHVETLALRNSQVDQETLGLWLDGGRLRNVRTLDLTANPLFAAGVESLSQADAPLLARLCLNGGWDHHGDRVYQITDQGAQYLARDRLPRLAALELRRNGISSRGVRWLVDSPVLEKLYLLDLRENRIGDEAARLLVGRGPWPRLACLNLRHNDLSRPAQRRLIETFGWRVVV